MPRDSGNLSFRNISYLVLDEDVECEEFLIGILMLQNLHLERNIEKQNGAYCNGRYNREEEGRDISHMTRASELGGEE